MFVSLYLKKDYKEKDRSLNYYFAKLTPAAQEIEVCYYHNFWEFEKF